MPIFHSDFGDMDDHAGAKKNVNDIASHEMQEYHKK